MCPLLDLFFFHCRSWKPFNVVIVKNLIRVDKNAMVLEILHKMDIIISCFTKLTIEDIHFQSSKSMIYMKQ